MSEQPLTLAALAQFHRQVILPDVERIVGSVEFRLRDEMHILHDVVLRRLDGLDIEYEMIKAGLQRVEGRLDAVDSRFDDLSAMVLELRTRLGRVEERLEELIAVEEKYPLRVEVQDLKARVERLHEDVRRLEQRIKPSTKG
jgi:chromosome segregation ATPase